MAHMVLCPYCRQKFDRDKEEYALIGARRYAHAACMLREAAKMAVCKINIDSDLRLAVTATIREHFALNPSHFDPRQYLGPAREAVKKIVKHKLVNVLGCNGKA